jgi:hypothetical protein
MMLADLPLPNAQDTGLGNDMIPVLSHVVEAAFDQVLDHLHTWLTAWPIAGSYADDVSLELRFDLELFSQVFCEFIAVPTEFLAFNRYH